MNRIGVTNLQRRRRVDRRAMVRAAEAALEACGSGPVRVNLVLMDDAQITGPHRRFLGIEGPTDVLSFRYPGAGPEQPEIEVLVSVQRAATEARLRGIPFEQEMKRYIVHGILHTLGYNDDTTRRRREMFRLQEGILRRLEGRGRR